MWPWQMQLCSLIPRNGHVIIIVYNNLSRVLQEQFQGEVNIFIMRYNTIGSREFNVDWKADGVVS